MATLISLERFVAPFRYEQEEVTGWVREWLEEDQTPGASRLLSVYASSGVKARASVVPIEDVFYPRDFETQNDRFVEIAKQAGIDVSRRAITSSGLDPSDIDFIVSVSCTGFMIPAVDAYVADALEMGPRLGRLPVTESGCAGGVVGLARARDYLAAYPDRCVLLLALEFSSLTFQRWDRSATNVVSTAIFGTAAPRPCSSGPSTRGPADARWPASATPKAASSRAPPTSWASAPRTRAADRARQGAGAVHPARGRERGPWLPRSARPAREDIRHWVLHPGGRRIIEAMSEQLELTTADLAPTEAVLAEHGNMSSVTVAVRAGRDLEAAPSRARKPRVARGLRTGFGAELALLEFR
jgi:predicted naringenin-chalcone synthase